MKRISLLGVFASIAAVFIVTLSVQGGMAANVNWQDAQQARFEETGLKPGETIEKGDWNKVEKLLPASIVEWLREGYLGDIKIGEFKYDPSPDEEFTKASLKNKGKFRLNENKILLEAATGEPPLCMYGLAFPGIDLKNDPDGAIKYMYNRRVCESRKRSFKVAFTCEWISKNGLDRSIESFWIEYNYWSRPLFGEAQNLGGYQYMELTPVIKPYDLAGTVQMCIRYLDEREDDVYVYIPAIRRVKKMSGANRSDPYMGADGCADDKFGWSGKIISMQWKLIGQKVGLLCVTDWVSEHPLETRRLPDGAWKAVSNEVGMKLGWQVKNFKGSPWAPVNAVWIPSPSFLVSKSVFFIL